MKVRSKLVVILALVLAVGMLVTACGTKPAESTPTTTASDTPSEKQLIEVTMSGIGSEYGKDKISEKIENDLKIKVVPVEVADTQALQLLASSDQLPDVFGLGVVDDLLVLLSWIDQGIIREVPQNLIDKYPLAKDNVRGDVNGVYANALKDNLGGYYMLPISMSPTGAQKMSAAGAATLYRKDWAASVGITKAPETIDELYAMGKAFTENDPDKNSKADTQGFLYGSMPTDFYQVWGVYPYGWEQDPADGKVKPTFVMDKIKEPLKWFHKIYQEKLVDQEMMQNTSATTMRQKWGQNKWGITLCNGDVSGINNMMAMRGWAGANGLDVNYPDFKDIQKVIDTIGITGPLKKDANTPAVWSKTTNDYCTCINSKVDDEKLDRIMELYDYLLKPEILELCTLGFENEQFKKLADGKYDYIMDPATSAPYDIATLFPSGSITAVATWNKDILYKLPNKAPGIIQYVQENDTKYNAVQPIDANYDLFFVSTPAKSALAVDFQMAFSNIITDTRDVDVSFKEFVDKTMADGLEQAIFEVTNKAKKLGFAK